MNPRVWDASGHTSSFSDPKIDCKNCKNRQRADNLIENFDKTGTVVPDKMTFEEVLLERMLNVCLLKALTELTWD